MPLINNHHYYVSTTSVILRAEPDPKSDPKNHLLFGDWLMYKGDTQNGFAHIFQLNRFFSFLVKLVEKTESQANIVHYYRPRYQSGLKTTF